MGVIFVGVQYIYFLTHNFMIVWLHEGYKEESCSQAG